MKVIALSDLHGNLIPMEKYEGDVLCICGDIFPLKAQLNMPQCLSWLKKKFIPWCEAIKVNKVLLLAGNHDFWFERTRLIEVDELFKDTKIVYLEVTDYEYTAPNGVTWTFHGTPYCKIFGNWAFMRDTDRLKEIYKHIPQNVDFLLTHDAPYGFSDICYQETPWNNFEHIGNYPLMEAIRDKNPKFNLHGHLHSSNHGREIFGDTHIYNVSILNEEYEVTYEPLIIEV